MKKYKKLISLSAVALIGITVMQSTQAQAEEKTRDTDGVVKFKAGGDEGPIDPVDPEEPEKPVKPIDPIDPEKPIDPGTAGPLSLDYASSWNFGEQKITTKDKTYYANTQKVTDPAVGPDPYEVANYVQVTDLRGTLAGWSLSVKQNGQFKTEDGATLEGAQLQLNNGTHESASASAAPGTVQNTITLAADGNGSAANIMAAASQQGGGTHILRFGSNDGATPEESTMAKGIQLTVPGRTEKLAQQYATKLTWTLSDVPGS